MPNDTQPPQSTSSSSQSNPAWSRDELILALDLYLKHRESLPSKHHAEVQELSQFLGKLGQALGITSSASFRNPNGVYMKLGNFRRWDPDYIKDGKTGLAKGNKDEEVVWNEFATSPNRLAAIVSAIRSTVEADAQLGNPLHGDDELDIQEAAEGKVLTRLHRTRERSRKLVEAKKKQALASHGKLVCEACGFDFFKRYGAAGTGLIDVHHSRPLHTLEPGQKTRLEDLILLCANCHRVVHASRHWLSLEQLKAALQKA
ncbi:HNH endonuclease [Pseudomonas sp. R-28-1W-6]|uniref:HNH endonuclease n=1 Tax=Pseudomonas sp. R-28-1W-6 TaxID=2650101 RepID=UPI001365BE4B|nr:HNH endonuclease [Pseudomonas sp. R-28-1W-6]MWV13735.1 HNH endonuclease [Pseudomonas sp. R-28-1W-6]